MTRSVESVSSREPCGPAPLADILEEIAGNAGEPVPLSANADPADMPESFSDLFERMRNAAPDTNAGFKQFLTNLADRVPIDWEGLLHGRTWQDLAISEIEDGIVLGIFRKAHDPLPEEGRAKFAEEWSEGGGNRAMLDAISRGDAKVLRKMDGRQVQLLRKLTWELSETGLTGSANKIAAAGKSTIYNNVEISGAIKFKGELVFGGKLKTGSIAGDFLVVEKNARIKGDVTVELLRLCGKIVGNVTVGRRCELEASAELIGDLTTQRLSMQEGATLVGQVRLGMDAGNVKPAGG